MTMRKYMVYLDDGEHCYKVAIPAANEKKAREYVAGNGEVIAVKDITADYPIAGEKVRNALYNAGFGEIEMDLILRTLRQTEIAE